MYSLFVVFEYSVNSSSLVIELSFAYNFAFIDGDCCVMLGCISAFFFLIEYGNLGSLSYSIRKVLLLQPEFKKELEDE